MGIQTSNMGVQPNGYQTNVKNEWRLFRLGIFRGTRVLVIQCFRLLWPWIFGMLWGCVFSTGTQNDPCLGWNMPFWGTENGSAKLWIRKHGWFSKFSTSKTGKKLLLVHGCPILTVLFPLVGWLVTTPPSCTGEGLCAHRLLCYSSICINHHQSSNPWKQRFDPCH